MEEYDLSSSEDYDSDAASEDGQRKRDWRQMRRKFLDDMTVNVAALKEHLGILQGSATGAAEGAAVEDSLVVLMGLNPGMSTFLKVGSVEEPLVLMERRVLRQCSVIFEVRPGSKARSWPRKLARGTHKRHIWLINEEFIVSKEVAGVHQELCREYVARLGVSTVSKGGQHMLSMKFHSGFVFTAHFETQRERDVWQSLLVPSEELFPYGMPFQEVTHSQRQVVFHRLHDDAIRTVQEKISRLEGLMAAQEAALVETGGQVSIRATKKRQMRMQRALYGALKQMHTLSLDTSRRLFGLNLVAPTHKRRLTVDDDASWSESDDESTTDESKPAMDLNSPPPSPPPQREVVPPMPSVAPQRRPVAAAAPDESEVLSAVRRQLALREVELTKVKKQLANLVNENWRKNLQVAQFKKDMASGNCPRLRRSDSSNSSSSSSFSDKVSSFTDVGGLVPRTPHPLGLSSPRRVAPRQNFLGLPLDILRHILKWVSLADVANLMLTCRLAHSSLSSDEIVWLSRLRRHVPLSQPVPPSLATLSSRMRLKALYNQFLCAGCETFLPHGPSDSLAWTAFQLPLCVRPECFREATISVGEAKQSFALDESDLVSLMSDYSPGAGSVLYRRRDVVIASYRKYGGPEGLAARHRALFKQRQLIALSKFKPMTTRPVDLLLDEDDDEELQYL